MAEYSSASRADLLQRIIDLEGQLARHNQSATAPAPAPAPAPESTDSLVKGSRSTKIRLTRREILEQKPLRQLDFSRYVHKYVAFKYAYLGWHYNGLVTQNMPTEFPTVEEEIFKALLKTKMIQHPDECNFSRCGRTDKGVSAMGQVMALRVRTNVLLEDAETSTVAPKYIEQLNGCLPRTIRILAYDDRIADDFSARFSCVKRHYKYLIHPAVIGSTPLDIKAMNEACKLLEGDHDFRNFCKLDTSKQITNFKRIILRCSITPLEPACGDPLKDLMVLDLEGTAFLWHQVRCITATLLAIGRGHEQPSLITQLLNVEQVPTKPSYEMANDLPLTLYDTDFGDKVKWQYGQYADRFAAISFATYHESLLQETISSWLVRAALDSAAGYAAQHPGAKGTNDDGLDTLRQTLMNGIDIGDGHIKPWREYTPVMKRKRGDLPEEVNARYAARMERRDELRKTQDTDMAD
ncbi:pseudouridine synthase [Protomyces lactucae-debilis]|uniref:tRNA pseudouridine synthase n=1 Tax=Protomyces lactucae-debilis TaxID=2754530 RepID=A0A1Y2F2S5_PROLT|nr:pseudouridine synthase [Protomyces lactucae-debilis]ORY77784.1 pseudouridine synthase [Protomyces lactucae-debilis]